MIRRWRFIKLKLALAYREARLLFVLGQINRQKRKITVHAGEKWLFMMRDSQIFRFFRARMGNTKCLLHPNCTTKAAFPKTCSFAVWVKPRPGYVFYRIVGIWSFTAERPAKKSTIKTGIVVGQTMILQDDRVDASVYRQKVILKDDVLPGCDGHFGGFIAMQGITSSAG